ncbi:hypothetical protein VZ94_21020 [Methylocucumis oryzae]|uniref:Uncharacterized protein n=1 Tax=Methylocucumis oryzae TaxID=1632867 RepID=A0A0F3IHW4_9GAMM|nr:hypothetical protein VZ94_21020 [Methylocucumis oryzae]
MIPSWKKFVGPEAPMPHDTAMILIVFFAAIKEAEKKCSARLVNREPNIQSARNTREHRQTR